MSAEPAIERLCQELMGLLGTDRQVEPFSRRAPGFDLPQAYDVVTRVGDLREARGEKRIGRKIGFTNRALWGDLGIDAPIWNYVFDSTVRNAEDGRCSLKLGRMPEPRIEPEVVLHLASAPSPGMSTADMLGCIDWVAPGFEVVYSIFPNWSFTAADAAAAYGVHGALIVGERLDVSGRRDALLGKLVDFAAFLESNRGLVRNGHGRNVLGGPLEALKFLVEDIARFPCCAPLRAGEIVTTGTLTEAMPAHPGESWTAQFHGIELDRLELHFE